MAVPSPSILVFDHDTSVRSWYRGAFESSDYRVAEAADGPEAAARLTRELPDLVITELRTGHYDGLTLCLLKRSNASTVDIPILMIMVEDNPDVEAGARLAGADELLTPVAAAGSSVMLTNDDARRVAVNAAACQLTGYSEAELLDRSVWDLTPRDTLATARMMWGRFLVNGECAGEFLMVRKDGTELPIQLCAVANVAPGIHAVASERTVVTDYCAA